MTERRPFMHAARQKEEDLTRTAQQEAVSELVESGFYSKEEGTAILEEYGQKRKVSKMRHKGARIVAGIAAAGVLIGGGVKVFEAVQNSDKNSVSEGMRKFSIEKVGQYKWWEDQIEEQRPWAKYLAEDRRAREYLINGDVEDQAMVYYWAGGSYPIGRDGKASHGDDLSKLHWMRQSIKVGRENVETLMGFSESETPIIFVDVRNRAKKGSYSNKPKREQYLVLDKYGRQAREDKSFRGSLPVQLPQEVKEILKIKK